MTSRTPTAPVTDGQASIREHLRSRMSVRRLCCVQAQWENGAFPAHKRGPSHREAPEDPVGPKLAAECCSRRRQKDRNKEFRGVGSGPGNASPSPTLPAEPAPPASADLCSVSVTGGVLLSGSSRLWPEPDKRGEHTRDDRGDGGGADEWTGKNGERRSPFVRHAPPPRHPPPPFRARVIHFCALIRPRGAQLASRTPTAW